MPILADATKQFNYYKVLGEKTIAAIPDEALFWQYNDASNSIAIIVNHLWGNMLSRWTNFLTEDGEKEWRQRDLEFEQQIQSREQLMEKWNAGWDCLFTSLSSIDEHNVTNTIYIRNQAHTVFDAVHRQLAHYSAHIGQIIYIGKMFLGDDWTTLSIAKGASKKYNQTKFNKGKQGGHFSDEHIQ